MDVLPQDRLVVLHNLSQESFLEALRLGGLPVPSLGVTKAVTPYTDFGEISLIGTRFLADPQNGKVYACDAYTPSAPKTRHNHIRKMANAEEAIRRMTSPAAQRRRGIYGTGRLLADAAGCFASLENLQAARAKVVEVPRARIAWKRLDGMLDRFVLDLTSYHKPKHPTSVARRETSAMKALLAAYRLGATKEALYDVLRKRHFFRCRPFLWIWGWKFSTCLPTSRRLTLKPSRSAW